MEIIPGWVIVNERNFPMAVKHNRTQNLQAQQVIGKKKKTKNGKVDHRQGGKPNGR